MKKIFKPLFIACAIVLSATTFTSCGEDTNDGIYDDGTGTDSDGNQLKELVVSTSDLTPSLEVTATPGSTEEILVKFSGADKNMKRLYITQNVYGNENGIQIYDLSESAVDTKGDGSIDLSKTDATEFSFKIPFQAPLADGGVIQYKLWATGLSATGLTSKGDIRDIAKRNAYEANAFGTITITAGTPNVSATTMKQFTATLLNAPRKDGLSKSFMSVYNGQTYQIKDAEETYSFWDFGYFEGKDTGVTLVSAASYAAVDVATLSGVPKSDLNTFLIEKTSVDFDSADETVLASLATPSTDKAAGLAVNDVLAFQDKYGAKGLIKIIKFVPGYGKDQGVTVEVKVQSIEPVKL